MTYNEISSAILSATLSNEEIDALGHVLREARRVNAQKLKFTLKVGSKVKINQTAKPRYLAGVSATVVKINQTKVVIDLDKPCGRFFKNVNCPVSLIEA